MNENELVDWLEDYASNSYCVEFEPITKMLRQQQITIEQDNRIINAQQQKVVELQAEIKALKAHPAELTDEEIKANTITEVLNYFENARYELDIDFVFKLKKHFQICGEEK